MLSVDHEKIEHAVRLILEAVGENPEREGLRETPARVARMYEEIFAGIGEDPAQHFSAIFSEDHEEIVIVKDIPFYSMCEHHLVPFFGKAHVGYIPRDGRVVGLSKLARAVETVAKRPQLQERMTAQIADAIMERLEAHGAIVVIEAEHLCMVMRGVKKPGSKTVTSAVRGFFVENAMARSEALSLIQGKLS
ncbi:MAG: GTP cyclohydrolase I FolE [Candidatus Carbobacillus altaicus]|nr:GTP cyclohydrolase I FolE [Candidatus Carbobacillus altaicus]